MSADLVHGSTWTAFAWPEWVPGDVRAQIVSFWREDFGRGPCAWHRSAAGEGSGEHPSARPFPELGARVVAVDRQGRAIGAGRYVHAWNSMGRVVLDDGAVLVVSAGPSSATRKGIVYACCAHPDPRRSIAAPAVVFLAGDPVLVATGAALPLRGVAVSMFYEHEEAARWLVRVHLPSSLTLEHVPVELVSHDPQPRVATESARG